GGERDVLSAHDLDVLPRHRLLRKPGGFEGFFAVREPMLANDLPLPESDNDPVVELDSCAGLPAAQVISEVHQDFVGPGISEFDVADARPTDPVGGVENRAVEAPGSLRTAHASLRPIVHGHDLAVLV